MDDRCEYFHPIPQFPADPIAPTFVTTKINFALVLKQVLGNQGTIRMHIKVAKSQICFLQGQTWSINQLNGSLLPSLPLLMVQTHDTATTKATTQMQNAPKTLQNYHMCIITTTQSTYKNIHDMIDVGKIELNPGQVHWPSKSCLLSYLQRMLLTKKLFLLWK